MTAGTGTASNIQNNTIRNFDWSNSTNVNWTGIAVAGGDVNIGTSTGNIIGSATGTGSISIIPMQQPELFFMGSIFQVPELLTARRISSDQ